MNASGPIPPPEGNTEPFGKGRPSGPPGASNLGKAGSREFSRRNILAGLGLGSLAAASAGQLLGASPAAAGAPIKASKPTLRAAAAPTPNPGPFSVRASCTLTEDYFFTSEVLLNQANGDRLIPFVNPKNNDMVEAIVFVKGVNGNPGTVNHLARDLSVPSGWNYTQLDTTSSVPWPADVAVASDSTTAYLMVLAEPGTSPNPAWLTQLDAAATWDSGYQATYDDLGYTDMTIDRTAPFGALKAGIDDSGTPYFYASVAEGSTTYMLGWVAVQGWSTGNFDYQLLQIIDSSAVTVTDYIVLFDTSGNANPVGYSVILDSGTNLAPYRQLAFTSQTNAQFDDNSFITGAGEEAVTELIWAWASPGSTTGLPGFAFQLEDDPDDGISAGTYFVDESGNQQTLSDEASLGNNAVTVWRSNGLYTVNLLDSNDTLTTTAQYDDGSGPTWGIAVPIAVGFTAVFGVPTDPNEATLFALDPSGVLYVLTKTATGWTQNLVHQHAASTIELATWNCQISLFDANGVGVGGSNGSVQLSTNLPIDVWQNNASSILAPGSPVVLAVDATGQVNVAIPTSELDTAQLTAVPLDAGGNSNGPALIITPNTDTQAYLAGTSSLSSAGGTTLSGDHLVGAKTSTWNSSTQRYTTSAPLMPVLGTAGAGAAGQVVQGINHVMSLPTNNPNQANNPAGPAQAALLDLTGDTPTFGTSTDPTAYDSHKSGDTHWWDAAEHDIDSVFHGLRHGAMSIGKMISTWASDVEKWTINLVIDLGDGIDRLINWVVQGIEDAYHAISGFFHSLGTDIEHIWDWLKTLVMGALRDAANNAEYIEGWVDTVVEGFIQEINAAESFTANFFAGLTTDVNTKLATLQDEVEDDLFGQHTAQPTPSAGTGGDDSGSQFEGVQDVFHFLAHSPAAWLMKKIMADIQPLTGSAFNGIELSSFAQPMTDLATDVDQAIDTIVDAATTIMDLFSDAAQSPASFNAQSMTDLFTGFEKVVDDVLALLDDLANTLLDLLKAFIEYFDDFLFSEFDPPLIGEILRLCGVDSTPSILHLTALTIAFPATLVHALFAAAAGGAGQPLFPFGAPGSDGEVGDPNSDWAGFGLAIASAVTQFIWATVEVGLEMIAYNSNQPSPLDLTLANLFTVIDIFCPIALTVLQWPVPPSHTGTQTPPPVADHDFTNGDVWGQDYELLPYIFISGGIPWLAEMIGFIAAKVLPDGQANDFNNKAVPLAQTIPAAVNIILSSWYSYANASNDGAKALAVIAPIISNLSYLDSIIASDQAKDALGSGIPWIKFYIDTFGNYGTVAIDVGEAIAAAAK